MEPIFETLRVAVAAMRDADVPFALGGPSTIENLELLCGPHNQRCAEFDFGDRFMSKFKRTS